MRRATAADEPLLFALFAAEKAREFAPLGLAAEQLEPLLEMQFRARQTGYAQTFPAATDFILCREDGTAVGRHLVERQADCYRCIDIAVLDEDRNRGIGTWALRQLQQIASIEGVPFRLRVMKNNPAQRLYERLGFIKVSGDELAYEMEWQAPRSARVGGRPETPCAMESAHGVEFDREEVTDRIVAFLREIGLEVQLGLVPSNSFLPGIQVVRNGLRVDRDALKYPGDLLHEAGHLAVMTRERRNEEFPHSNDAAEEMAAMAWSYAAALHIGIAPEIVFHEAGYRGQSASLLDGYRRGTLNGQPILWWLGLTTPELPGNPTIYPKMLRWVREAEAETQMDGSGIGAELALSTAESQG
ncbi:MAG: GNAT family N-acetyltransferase [Acidobacteriota bacterium]